MISIQNLAKGFGPQQLFRDVNLQLNPGSRYGLVGANGCGKSTFMAMLAGDEGIAEGSIGLPKKATLGVLRQDHYLADEELILSLAMMGDEPAWQALERQRKLLLQAEPDPLEFANCEEAIMAHDGYRLEARAGSVLAGLGIAESAQRRPLNTLSGGFKLRVLLAQVLVANPDILLLDEPTNHLDILTIRWLEEFLLSFRGCAVVISHDQRFLNAVCSHTLDVDYGTITEYVGNYAAFEKQKLETRERKEAEIARQEQKIAEKKAFIERFRAKATKARQAQSRAKQIEKIEIQELPRSSRRTPSFGFLQQRPSGQDVLKIDGVAKAYGSHRVLSDIGFQVRRGERVAIIGGNGLGKSTLLKIALGELEADGGGCEWGYETHIGYFPQDHHSALQKADESALQYLWRHNRTEPESQVRGRLGAVLFNGDDVHKPIGALSGGEAARVILSRVISEQPNVLVLDEPTNHLDMEAIHGLLEGLKSYLGTILFVSHDRWFVEQLATRIVEIKPDGFDDYPGTYADYLTREGEDYLNAATQVANARKQKSKTPAVTEGKFSHAEQKKRRNRIKQLEKRRDHLTELVDETEETIASVQEKYCEPGFYDKASPEEIENLQAEEKSLAAELEQAMGEWESVETELEELGAG